MSNMRETELSLQETVSGHVDITPPPGNMGELNGPNKVEKKIHPWPNPMTFLLWIPLQ
ncbi:hypothetical protein BGS_0081 [Beggiatoa sp. SS]|nr:hypothetical protein BGS_0081 [Beggiatoa sp. SS]